MIGQTILVAEDDRFIRRAAETILTRRGYSVITATNGEEALEAVRTSRPALILLDLIMPKLQGFEVLRTLKADPATSAIPVIVVSNLSQDRDREAALSAGAIDYFVKANLSLDDLAAAVDRALAVPV